jgi:hypothetical protein
MVAVEDVSEDELFCVVVITEQLGIVSLTALLLLLLAAVCNVEHKLEFETIAVILLLLLFVASRNSLRLFEFNGNIGLP